MKTIIFHSYKGGQGRTTCLANLAAALYRLDKRVCAVDLDIESPGLPPKFGYSVFGEPTYISEHGGVFNHLLALLDGNRNADLRQRCLDVGQSSTLGKLLVLPTYHVGTNYFQNRRAQRWKDLMAPDEINHRKRDAFLALRADVENLPEHPEYLLIDLPSGLTHLAETVFTVLAETVVLFFSLDPENLEGTRFVNLRTWDRVRENRNFLNLDNKKAPIRVIPVISRLGPFLGREHTENARVRAAKEIFNEAGPEDAANILTARADPDLDREWHLHITPDARPLKNVGLTRDYLQILAQIDPALGTPEEIAAKLRLPNDPEDRYKMFGLDDGGVMVNLTDESKNPRNVSFKVRTFCSILDDIHDQMLGDPVGAETTQEEQVVLSQMVRENFRHAGEESGTRFGENLVEMWKEKGDLPVFTRRLKEWCAFDSQVGFGRLESRWTSENGGRPSGTVEVARNFLADQRTEEQRDLCVLMIGYIKGVLEQILDCKIDVSHPRDHCMRCNTVLTSCTFNFSVID